VASPVPESDERVSPLVIAALLLAASEPARRHGLSHPTVDQIMTATGATRSRAYELRDELMASLPSLQHAVGRPAATPSTPSLDALQTLLTVSRSTMQFLIAHPGCVSGAGRQRYTDVYRRHVIDLRADHSAVPLARFAEAVCVPLETFEDWLRVDATAPLPDIAGGEAPSDAVDELKSVKRAHIQTVVDAWQRWSGTFTDFCTHVNTNFRVPYRATMISTILFSHGLRTPRRREGRSPDERALRNAFRVFFPNAQWVGDGSALSIDFCGERFTFNLQLNVDAYSGAFVGLALSDEEDGRAVADAFRDAKATTSVAPIAELLDNKACNLSPEVTAALAEQPTTVRILSTLARPQNKGHVEGAFGLFKTTAPPLVVVGASAREITRSILALVVTTFFRAANHRPRADRNGRSRVQINGDEATPEQIDEARTALNETARRQELARRTLEARQTPEVRTYLDDAFARLGLDDPERSVRIAISRYPLDAIVDGVAIYFGKIDAKTLPETAGAPYLLGIVRNIAQRNEGAFVTVALLRERMAVRDRMLDALRAEQENVIRNNPAVDDQLKAFAERACEIDAVLDRRFWLLVIVDTIRAQPPTTHSALVQLVSRRIHGTYRIKGHERRDAVLFVVARVVPLH